jgi:hypothetical protein
MSPIDQPIGPLEVTFPFARHQQQEEGSWMNPLGPQVFFFFFVGSSSFHGSITV